MIPIKGSSSLSSFLNKDTGDNVLTHSSVLMGHSVSSLHKSTPKNWPHKQVSYEGGSLIKLVEIKNRCWSLLILADSWPKTIWGVYKWSTGWKTEIYCCIQEIKKLLFWQGHTNLNKNKMSGLTFFAFIAVKVQTITTTIIFLWPVHWNRIIFHSTPDDISWCASVPQHGGWKTLLWCVAVLAVPEKRYKCGQGGQRKHK